MPGTARDAFGVAGSPWDIETIPSSRDDRHTSRFRVMPKDRAISDSWIDVEETPDGWFVTENSLNSTNQLDYVLAVASIFSACQGKLDAIATIMDEMRVNVESGKYKVYREAEVDFQRRWQKYVESQGATEPKANPGATAPSGSSRANAASADQEPAAPETVSITDLLTGSGTAAARGGTVKYHYICSLPDGTVVFDSRPTGKTRTRVVGEGKPPVGLDDGLVGVRKGMHRRLRIPPNLAYGSKGLAPGIPPDTAIIIDLFVEEVKPK
jgi:FKBP-type peptidyl-prolyl cis-trans isomerase